MTLPSEGNLVGTNDEFGRCTVSVIFEFLKSALLEMAAAPCSGCRSAATSIQTLQVAFKALEKKFDAVNKNTADLTGVAKEVTSLDDRFEELSRVSLRTQMKAIMNIILVIDFVL